MTTLDKKGQSITVNGNTKSNIGKTPLDFLFESLGNNDAIVLKAMTGSGKSTSMPIYMLNRFPSEKIAMTQPRIVNVNGIRERIRDLTKKPDMIGSITGQGSNLSGSEKLIIYTEGSYDVNKDDNWVIIDEAHERTASVDLLLAQLIEQKGKKKLIITSATIDPEVYRKYLSDAGWKVMIAEVKGVAPEYDSPIFLNGDVDNYVESAIDIIVNKINTVNSGKRNILVFLPSVAIIKNMHGLLNFKLNGGMFNIVELYRGNIDVESIVKRDSGIVNIILATNVAETGITFDNLKYVIDSGWTNNGYYNPESNIDMLLKGRITGNMALQRWGRSGRSRDKDDKIIKGVIYALYTKDFYENSIKNYKGLPNILTGRMDGLLLQNISKGNLRFMDDIPPQSRERSTENLYLLWAIDDNRKITELGQMILDLRLEPRWAKIILASVANDCVYPIVGAMSFIITGTNAVGMPKMYNYYFSDHWEYWLLFKKYFRSDALREVWARFVLILRSLKRIGFNVEEEPDKFNIIEDSEDLWKRFKQCIYSGLYMNMARQNDIDPSVYISNMNPEVMGRVSGSVVFTKSVNSVFPKKIVYDSALLSYSALGVAEYKFLNATRAD